MNSYPKLPPELEREIFEIASTQCQKEGMRRHIAQFALVALRVSQWVEPFLYAVWMYAPVHSESRFSYPPLVTLEPCHCNCDASDSNSVHDCPRHSSQTRPLKIMDPRYAKHIKHILLQLDPCSQCDDLASVLESCPNLTSLSLWLTWYTNTRASIHNVISKLPITRLTLCSLDAAGVKAQTFDYSLFSKITHLYAGHVTSSNLDNLLPLSSSPSLTHLCIGTPDLVTVRAVLETFHDLKVLAVSVAAHYRHKIPPELVECKDRRLVFVRVHSHYVPLFKDWEAGAFRGEGMWAFADEVYEAGLSPSVQLDRLFDVKAEA